MQRLEPYAGKLARTVLRGEWPSNVLFLPDFCVSDDHRRQEEVWERLSNSYNREPYTIRRMLTEGAVRGQDRRARLVGAEAYEKSGGVILRDLFSTDEDGWFADAALLDRLTLEKLQAKADEAKSEGWKWAKAAADFPYSERVPQILMGTGVEGLIGAGLWSKTTNGKPKAVICGLRASPNLRPALGDGHDLSR